MKIIIPGKPIPKQRARYSKRGRHVITYDSQESDKKRVRNIMTSQLADIANSTNKATYLELGKICAGKVFSVQFLFFLPINSSDSVVAGNKKLWGITRASTKPDYDNLEKFYLDCANGILWGDDSTVVQARAIKLYSEEPRVEIVINAVEEVKLCKSVESVITAFSPSEFETLQHYAQQIANVSELDVEELDASMLQDKLNTIACLLSEFALNYGPKLTKIAKLGDITSEVKKLQEYKLALEA